jgi:hypothetical protein
MNEINLTINEKQVTIRKLPLRRYADLLAAFQELPLHINEFQGVKETDLVSKLPQLISTCYPDVVRVLQIITELTPQEVDEMGLDDLTDILEAFFTVNNYSKIYEAIKKVIARPATPLQETRASEIA